MNDHITVEGHDGAFAATGAHHRTCTRAYALCYEDENITSPLRSIVVAGD